jgi:hypothetical protein
MVLASVSTKPIISFNELGYFTKFKYFIKMGFLHMLQCN